MKKHIAMMCLCMHGVCMSQEAAPGAAPAPATAAAPASVDEPAVVQVEGIRNPMMHSYRTIIAGLDAFDKFHALAPTAPEVRFRLAANKGAKGRVSSEPLTLRIVGSGEPVVLPVGADGTVLIPRIQSAYDDKADVVLNRRKDQLHGTPEVRTPGLPANVRRLGDVRLECQIVMAMVKNEIPFLLRAAGNVALGTDWCNLKKGSYWWSAPGVIEDAFISYGNRSAAVKSNGRAFLLPIPDPAWPDDALIAFKLFPELSAEELAVPWTAPMYVMGTMNQWSPRTRLTKTAAGLFSAALALEKGKHELKIGTLEFDHVDLGGVSDVLTPGTAAPLMTKGKNLKLSVDQPGAYVVTLDVRQEGRPQLMVVPKL